MVKIFGSWRRQMTFWLKVMWPTTKLWDRVSCEAQTCSKRHSEQTLTVSMSLLRSWCWLSNLTGKVRTANAQTSRISACICEQKNQTFSLPGPPCSLNQACPWGIIPSSGAKREKGDWTNWMGRQYSVKAMKTRKDWGTVTDQRGLGRWDKCHPGWILEQEEVNGKDGGIQTKGWAWLTVVYQWQFLSCDNYHGNIRC